MNDCKQMTLREVMDLRRQLNASDTCYKPEQTSVASEIDNMFCDFGKKIHKDTIIDAIYKIALIRRYTSSLHCIQFLNKD